MKTLRRGDRGAAVKTLQKALNASDAEPGLTVDGLYGQLTKRAVEDYQRSAGLYDDGIVGRATWRALGVEDEPAEWVSSDTLPPWHGWKKVSCDMTVPGDPDKGYDSTTLRVDVAEAFSAMRMEAVKAGAKITSAGGRRRVKKNASPNQSKKSMHYVGRAHDLALPSGMQNPQTDLYVVEPDPAHPGYWIVWARAEHGTEMAIDGWVHATQSTKRVTGRFVNLTDLMAKYGFERIKARRSYRKDNYLASEWWHWQKTDDLITGESRFGDELLKVWSIEELEGTTPWEFRDAIFGVDWF